MVAGREKRGQRRSRKHKPDDISLARNFIEAAKALGARHGGEYFDRAMQVILRAAKERAKSKRRGEQSDLWHASEHRRR